MASHRFNSGGSHCSTITAGQYQPSENLEVPLMQHNPDTRKVQPSTVPIRIVVTIGPHPDQQAFADELLGHIAWRIDDTDIKGVPVTYGIEGVS